MFVCRNSTDERACFGLFEEVFVFAFLLVAKDVCAKIKLTNGSKFTFAQVFGLFFPCFF